ncbi:MAG: threonylcarbamoyl-AMP synthase [Burkholderiaceae bacterium]|jgi:L-threonylcarbamoyladenylate synthase|nr:threonylcarbamoyl-AMP synthase [Burkholderiaceae bacterium]
MILDGNDPREVREAARALAAGELVGLPTETVYGLAANAHDDVAVAAIFAAKGRPADHPLIVHVLGPEQAEHFAVDIAPFARQLMARFWPGPLTLILPRRPGVGDAAAGGHESIGLRCPSHPVAQAVLAACAPLGVWGLAAPSANRFGRVSPTCADHVVAELGASLRILDGGACPVGIESTIVDCTRGAPVLLRPGHVLPAEIEAAASVALVPAESVAPTQPRASGTLEAHYAPSASLRLMDAKALQTALDLLGADARHLAVYARTVLRSRSEHIVWRRMPSDAAAAAQQLFATLREFDQRGVRLIWVETPPADEPWDGVRDRLRRAAAAA